MHSTHSPERIQERAQAFADALAALLVVLAERSPSPIQAQPNSDWVSADDAAKHFAVGAARIRRAGREHPEVMVGRGRGRRYRLSALEPVLRAPTRTSPIATAEGERILARGGLVAVRGGATR